MEIKIRLPRIPSGAFANVIGLLGLLWFAVAVGGLTGNWWWSILVGSVQAVALAYVAQTHVEAEKAESRPTLVAEASRTA